MRDDRICTFMRQYRSHWGRHWDMHIRYQWLIKRNIGYLADHGLYLQLYIYKKMIMIVPKTHSEAKLQSKNSSQSFLAFECPKYTFDL